MTDDRPQWWLDAVASGDISTPEFDPMLMPENQYGARVQHALETRGRRLVSLYCAACQKNEKRKKSGALVAEVCETSEGPMFIAETRLVGPEYDDMYHQARASWPKGTGDLRPTGSRHVLLEVPLRERPAFSTFGARCYWDGELAVLDYEITAAIEKAKRSGRVQALGLKPIC